MLKSLYKTITVVAFVVVTAVFIQYVLERFVASKFSNFSDKEEVFLEYSDFSVQVFPFGVLLENPMFQVSIGSNAKTLNVTAKKLEAKGFSIKDFFFKKKIYFDNLELRAPSIKILEKQTAVLQSSNLQQNDKSKFDKVNFGNVEILDGSLTYFEKDTLAPTLEINKFTLKSNDLEINTILKKNEIPLKYTNFDLEATGLEYKMSKFEKLRADAIAVKNEDIDAKGISIQTIYSKRELSRYLVREKDHIDLKIPTIEIQSWFYKKQNGTNIIGANTFTISNATLGLFRDKSVEDSEKYKSLYSERIRKLSFKIDFPIVKFKEAQFNYEQLLEDNQIAGKLNFSNINALASFSNFKNNTPQIKFQAKGNFMGISPVVLNTTFNSFDSDEFVASGSIKQFDASSIEAFLEKNQGIRIQGKANEVYYNILGNNVSSTGSLKIKYEDLELEILRKDKLKVNKLLTAIGSLFLKDTNQQPNEFKNGVISTKRDQTKSFFNFLWISIRSGLKDVLLNR